MKSLTDRFHCRGGRASLLILTVNAQSSQLCVLLDIQQRWKVKKSVYSGD